ncbi:MAG TPA: YARHG domain-containing protein [Patescibacteria group bacterium]
MTPTRWMMPAIVLFSFTAGCKDHSAASVVKDRTVAHTLSARETSVTGTWCGMFEPTGPLKMLDKATGDSIPVPSSKITLFIDQIQDGEIFGYSVCAGNDRPFRGVYTEEGDKITATLKEPGDNKYDGVFDLVISKNPLSLTGKWTPFNAAQSDRHYTLMRKNFVYNATAGQYSESSVKLLTSDKVNNLYKNELRLMRNEIYARHGYSFKLKDVRELFDNQDWYMPISTDVRKKLTTIEIKNEKLIKQFEKYAEENYDDYGR